MPLFGRNRKATTPSAIPPAATSASPDTYDTTPRRSGILGRRSRSVSPQYHHTTAAADVPVESHHRRSGLFGHRRSVSPIQNDMAIANGHNRQEGGVLHRHNDPSITAAEVPVESHHRRGGLFGHRRSVSPPHNDMGTINEHGRHGGSALHRHNDPSITAAQERVLAAENAERDADRALLTAKSAVRNARDEVRRLEREAAEESRLAKIKQSHARSISKRAKPLGRHDHIL